MGRRRGTETRRPGRRGIRLAAGAVLAAAACAAPGPGGPAGEPAPPVRVGPDLEVRRLAPGVWLHTTWRAFGDTRFPSHGLVVEDGDGLLLVDSAWGDAETEALVAWLEEELGRPVTRMVVTHHHDDRVSGVPFLRERGVEVLGHPLTPGLAAADGFGAPDPVAGLAAAGSAVRLGPVELFYPGPGHAVDNLVVWVPGARLLFGGCLVRPLGTSSAGNVEDAALASWPGSVARVRDRYGTAETVVPGHGPPAGPEVLDHTIRVVEAAASATPAPTRTVAITVDDLPYTGAEQTLADARIVTEGMVAALRAWEAPATAFVTGGNVGVRGEIDARLDMLRAWRDAGTILGNHTWHHRSFQDTDEAWFFDDVVRGDLHPSRLMAEVGDSARWFRAPFNHTGESPGSRARLEAALAERGLRLAPFTVEHADYMLNALYLDAVGRGEGTEAAEWAGIYLAQLDSAFAFAERLSTETFGREIAQVFLVHANRLNAAYLPAMLTRLRARGYRFVTLDEAVRDDAYATPDTYTGGFGISWLHRWRVGLGMENRLRAEPDYARRVYAAYEALSR